MERELIDVILTRASELGARLFRVNTGQAWTGEVVRNKGSGKQAVFLGPNDIVLRNARPFRAGLVKGGSDMIGITPVVITPDMVGKTVGAFTAYEAKTGRLKATEEQGKFLEMVRRLGGIGKVVRSVEDIERVPDL
ncbi:hypothetical protein [Microvirga mediterraneensis]|uniref:VRR-NUC domain-containing protein n=1 Tax=Microvirga mediterraneensis TaxID=2754695 RepID=A0A838BWW6_9HYPH|nr:hypothetical protein [Microvirga mediterraneensis]MBA1159355.1 hypothetical protein [Microvirga mediterraneensis]